MQSILDLTAGRLRLTEKAWRKRKRYLSLLVIVSKEFVGYLLAAIGPIALGKIYDVCHS